MNLICKFGLLFMGFGLMIWRSYALMLMWNWFVSPGFGVAPVTLATAAGVSMIFGMIRMSMHRPVAGEKEPTNGEELQRLIVHALAVPIGIGFAWLVLILT